MRNPYGAILDQCETPRETEARLLREVNRAMQTAREGSDVRELAMAVSRNRRVWTAFAVDLAGEGNQLPTELRAGLLSIAGAVDRTCSEALAGSREALATLIEINRNIAAALG